MVRALLTIYVCLLAMQVSQGNNETNCTSLDEILDRFPVRKNVTRNSQALVNVTKRIQIIVRNQQQRRLQ